MFGHVGDWKGARQRLFKLYQQRLDAAWPGAGARLKIDGASNMSLNLNGFKDLVTDLTPLRGMQLLTTRLLGSHPTQMSNVRGPPRTPTALLTIR